MKKKEDKEMIWVDDELDSLCPVCKKDMLEYLVDEDEHIHKERCQNGCYVYNFDTQETEQ